jgi:ribosomal protein S18 acetylase RimI-like enzyme
MITIAPGASADLDGLNPFVAASIRDAFDRPDLKPEEIAENDRIVGIAERVGRAALDHPHRAVLAAKKDGRLAGFAIVDRKDESMPEIDWLIVAPEWQSKGVAYRLMEHALAWIGDSVPVQLGVIHFNERAIAFYRKSGSDRRAASDTAAGVGTCGVALSFRST